MNICNKDVLQDSIYYTLIIVSKCVSGRFNVFSDKFVRCLHKWAFINLVC